MRTFIAIDLPAVVKEKISATQIKLKKIDPSAKWVRPDNMHLTLKFLGEVEQEKIPEIKKTMESVAAKHPALTVTLEAFGFFPNEKRPRVFFISTSGQKALKALADDLETALQRLGFEPEGRFQSHVTLARLTQSKNADYLLTEIKNIKLGESFHIGEIILYKSTLTGTGPIYEIIAKIALTA